MRSTFPSSVITVTCGEGGPARARIVGGRSVGRVRVRVGRREEEISLRATATRTLYPPPLALERHTLSDRVLPAHAAHTALLHMSWSPAIDWSQRTRPHAWSVLHAVTGKVVVAKVAYKKGSLKISYSLPDP